MDLALLGVVSVLVFASVAVLAWALLPDVSRRVVRKRLYSEVSAEKRQPPLTPLANLLSPLHRRLPLGWYLERATKGLEAAGVPAPPVHFLITQEMGALAGVMCYFATHGGQPFHLTWFTLFTVLGCLVPVFWLGSRTQNRRLTIQRDLPEIVDLLTLSVGAGSDFMNALGRIVREFRPCPVREELAIVLQEVGVGKRRRDALRAFAQRLKTPEASTFARTIIQVDRMGTGLVEALAILSEDMRLQRYHWAERFAQQAPMKMLIPLIFSLGAAMVIVAGPIFVQFFRGGLMAPQTSVVEGQQAGEGRLTPPPRSPVQSPVQTGANPLGVTKR